MALEKRWLNINGVDRTFVCDQNESLADVLRRMGLTGTKIGCNVGVCGACSVILNGKLVRSCVVKMKKIEEYSTVLTVEGIGTPRNLHPIQQAFVTFGGIQCGFCTPGFIVSSYALLTENQNPTREDVRDWFTKNKNACRCTGWKPIIDCVMAAAKVMRGEATMEDITFKNPVDGKIYGTAVPRPAAIAKATGTCDYGDDIGMKMPENTLYLAPVMPHVNNGRILNIDDSEAMAMEGVVKVLTAKDVKGSNILMLGLGHPKAKGNGIDREVLNSEKVYRYGDVVALVAAKTQKLAREAAKKVKVEIERLPEYMTFPEAVAPGAEDIHPGVPNDYLDCAVIKGEDTEKIFEEAEYVVEGSFYSEAQPHQVIEPTSCQAYFDEDGNLTLHSKTLVIPMVVGLVPSAIGIAPEKLRVIENPTGASFGCHFTPADSAMVGVAAMALNCPVSMTFTYPEHTWYTGKRAPSYSNSRLACDKNGKILAAEYDFAFDHGAYTEIGEDLVTKAQRFPYFGYYVPNVRAVARLGYTNSTYGCPYRAFGCAQAYTMSEQMMDMMAEKIGMDPFEFRYLNLAKEGDDNINMVPYKDYPFSHLMDCMKPHYEELKKKAKELNDKKIPNKFYGVGIANAGYNITGGPNDHAEVFIELAPDGAVVNYNTWEDQGQGSDVGSLVHTAESLRKLGYTPTEIRLVQADTKYAPLTGAAGANRSHYMAGNAIYDGCEKLVNAMKKADGTFRTYEEMKAEGIETKYLGVYDTSDITTGMDPNTSAGDPTPEYNYVDFMALCEVDTETGKTTVMDYKMFYDIGPIGSIHAVEGQGYGSLIHSLGYALSDEYRDDAKHGQLTQLGFRYANDCTDNMELYDCHQEGNHKTAVHGSVGCCEGFQSAGHVAIINAIYDAVGVRVYEMPATPKKMKELLAKKAAGEDLTPEPYYLGEDMWDILDDYINNPAIGEVVGTGM